MHPPLLIHRERTQEIHCRCGVQAGSTAFHFHSQLELYLIESGEVDVWINQKRRRLHTGEMAVSLSYDAHQYEPAGHAVICYLTVPAHICGEWAGKQIFDPFLSDPVLFKGVRQCCEVIEQRRNPLLTEGSARVAFGLLMEGLQFAPRETAAETDEISKILLYLQEHFTQAVSLGSTAAAFGFTPSSLSRQFSKSLGVSFHQYLTMLRLREAVVHLSRGKSVDFCASESGFQSIRTFYRAFTAEFGCAPGEYAKGQGRKEK